MASKKKAVKKAAPKKAIKKAAKKAAPKKNNNRPRPKNGCYFTTACTRYFGLPDNCQQLMTLRNFRDNVLSKTENGRKLIALYYQVAPSIVLKIENSISPEEEYNQIFHHINQACNLINGGENESAKKEYIKMVNHLIEKYL